MEGLKMTALDIYVGIIAKLRSLAKLCAVDVFDANLKMTWNFVAFEIVMGIAMFSEGWTLYKESIVTGLTACTSLGTVLQVKHKLWHLEHQYLISFVNVSGIH